MNNRSTEMLDIEVAGSKGLVEERGYDLLAGELT